MSKTSNGGAHRTRSDRGRQDDEDVQRVQRLSISAQGRGRASKATKTSPPARITRGAALRLAEADSAIDASSPMSVSGDMCGKDQSSSMSVPPAHVLASAKKSSRPPPPPPIVVSEKAAALARALLMNPLLEGGAPGHTSVGSASPSPAATAAAAAHDIPLAGTRGTTPPAIGTHARNAFESRRNAARAIAAVAASGPRITRSQHAAMEAGGGAHRTAAGRAALPSAAAPMAPIAEASRQTRASSSAGAATAAAAAAAPGPAAAGHLRRDAPGQPVPQPQPPAPPVSIALPPCVPSIDVSALSFDPSGARMLGRGSYGVVYEGRYMGQPVAVKVQELHLHDQDDLDELSVEAVLGSSLHHPGLLRTMAASVYSYGGGGGSSGKCGGKCGSDRHEVHMVMELMPDSNVLNMFRDRSPEDLGNLLLAASIAEQVAWALDFLHSGCGMLHLDVKGANVLVRLGSSVGTVVAKLADFGLTVKRHEAVVEEGGMRDRGTPRYMGPEFWDDELSECIGEAADVYALGCVMWEMASQGTPFLSDKTDAQVARAKGRAHVAMPSGTPQLNKYADLAQRCRSLLPEDRPRVRDVALELKVLCEKLRQRLRLA